MRIIAAAAAVLILLFISACEEPSNEASKLELDELYQNHKVKGCFLLKSLKSGQTYIYNQNRCERGFLPASTFKIANSIIALETGVAANEELVIVWDSVVRQVPTWNQDHNMRTAFQASCVPYYREIARRIGTERMQNWVNKLHYGKLDIRAENLDNFWLKGKSKITPFEQLDFLERFTNKELPIKPSTLHKVNDIMTMASDPSGMIMRGKTGWAIVEDRNIGWFVGSIERPDGEKFVFVNNVEAKVGAINDDDFMMVRKDIVGYILKDLGVI